MKNILLRFDENDSFINAIDEVCRKLQTTRAGLIRVVLWDYCNKFLNSKNGRKFFL